MRKKKINKDKKKNMIPLLNKATLFKIKKKESPTSWQEIGYANDIKSTSLTNLQFGEFVTFVTYKNIQSITNYPSNIQLGLTIIKNFFLLKIFNSRKLSSCIQHCFLFISTENFWNFNHPFANFIFSDKINSSLPNIYFLFSCIFLGILLILGYITSPPLTDEEKSKIKETVELSEEERELIKKLLEESKVPTTKEEKKVIKRALKSWKQWIKEEKEKAEKKDSDDKPEKDSDDKKKPEKDSGDKKKPEKKMTPEEKEWLEEKFREWKEEYKKADKEWKDKVLEENKALQEEYENFKKVDERNRKWREDENTATVVAGIIGIIILIYDVWWKK